MTAKIRAKIVRQKVAIRDGTTTLMPSWTKM
jgi:hypothetical protein